MNHLSRILAAVDDSGPARAAFEHALSLSRRDGAELVLVHAVSNHAVNEVAHEPFSLAAALRLRAAEAGVRMIERIAHGDPADVILSHAKSLHPDVIVMGTQRRNGLERLRKGSVAERVIARAAVPVLLIPRGAETKTIGPFHHVAVAVDFGPSSARAIEEAATVATVPADRLTLLHVVPRVAPDPAEPVTVGLVERQRSLLQDDQVQLARDAVRRLHRALPRQQHTRAAMATRVLTGKATAEIPRAVDDMGADLLIVGVRKRGALRRALFGSTAARLARAVTVPVLAVPAASARAAHQERSSVRLAA